MDLAGRHLLVCPLGEAILGVCGGVESRRTEGMLVGCFVLELEISVEMPVTCVSLGGVNSMGLEQESWVEHIRKSLECTAICSLNKVP
jgi:hypothetical protein